MNWQRKKLGEICEIIAGQAPPSMFYNEEGDGVPFLTVNSFGDVYPKVERWTTKSLRESKEGDVLFSVAGSLGLVNLGINACITRSIFALRPYKDLILQKFLFYTLKKYGSQIALMGSGTAQKVITINQISKFEIPVPPIHIQQKIVKILDTIQSAVEVQEKIIEKTKELKKALMNLLFHYGLAGLRIKELAGLRVDELTSSEIKKLGLKLKKTEIGEIPEHWEVVRLGNICEIVYGVQASVSELKAKIGRIPILTNKNITDGGMIDLSNLNFYPEDSVVSEKHLLKKGDIIFNWRSGSIEHVGKSALFVLDGKFTFASFLLRFRPRIDIADPYFLNCYLNKIRKEGFLKFFAHQASINQSLNASISSNIPIPLPPLSEQKEIAEILQTIDQKIEIEKKKKELYYELFKTLLNKIMNQEIEVDLLDY
jgi:type I restriction enzyme S subunit